MPALTSTNTCVWDGAYWKKMMRRGQYPLWLFRALRFGRIALRAKHYDTFLSRFSPKNGLC